MERIAKIEWEKCSSYIQPWDDPDHWGEEELLENNGKLILKGWQDALFFSEKDEWEFEPTKKELARWLVDNNFRQLYFVKGRKRAKAKAEKMMPNWMRYMNAFYDSIDMPSRYTMRDYFRA